MRKLMTILAASVLMFSSQAMAITEVNDATFEKEVLKSKTPVVLITYAEWCVWCKELLKSIPARETEYGAKVKFVKINVETTSLKGMAMALPTTLLLKNGKVVNAFAGFDLLKLDQMLEEATK